MQIFLHYALGFSFLRNSRADFVYCEQSKIHVWLSVFVFVCSSFRIIRRFRSMDKTQGLFSPIYKLL